MMVEESKDQDCSACRIERHKAQKAWRVSGPDGGKAEKAELGEEERFASVQEFGALCWW